MNKVICVDFDGTIVDHCYPEIGEPVPGAIEWLKIWAEYDIKIILWTMRSGFELSQAIDYMNLNKIKLFGANQNPEQDSWTSSPKAYAQVYIDDAAVGCPLIQYVGFKRKCVNWDLIGREVEQRLGIK